MASDRFPGKLKLGRCFKGVDPVLDNDAKFILIDKEANHQVVHAFRLRKAHCPAYQTLDPRAQVEVLALDFLGVLLAHMMLLWDDVPLVRAPPIGVKAGDTKRFQ